MARIFTPNTCLVLVAAIATGCAVGTVVACEDTGLESASDAGLDAASDAGLDAATDAAPDAADGAPDAGCDWSCAGKCGNLVDSCGEQHDCEGCASPLTCGGSGTPNVCGNPREYCASTPDGPVCIDYNVAGNQGPETLTDLWPLPTGPSSSVTWKMNGITNKYDNGTYYKLQLKVEDNNPQTYEGQVSVALSFVKNHPEGYWGPGSNENMTWMLIPVGQSGWNWLWSRGAKVFDRGCYSSDPQQSYPPGCTPADWHFSRRYGFESLDAAVPPYILIPQQIAANPTNDPLGNARSVRHQYSSCWGAEDCVLVPMAGHVSWFMGLTSAAIKAPAWGDVWVDAKRIENVELSLPAGSADSVTDPYSNDPAFACRCADGSAPPCSDPIVPYYRGVREDWYFVPSTGVAIILTRDVGLDPDRECIYDVARQDLTFANSDTFAYLIRKDATGYDPSWAY